MNDPIYQMQFKGGYACGKKNWPFDAKASNGWKAGYAAGQQERSEDLLREVAKKVVAKNPPIL